MRNLRRRPEVELLFTREILRQHPTRFERDGSEALMGDPLGDDLISLFECGIDIPCPRTMMECDIRSELFMNDGGVRFDRFLGISDDIQRVIIDLDQIDCVTRLVVIGGDNYSNCLADEDYLALCEYWEFRHLQIRQGGGTWHIADLAVEF